MSFLLRIAHDKASGKEAEDPEATMKAQIKQLVAQIQTGEAAKQDAGHQATGSTGASYARRMPVPSRFGSRTGLLGDTISDW